MKKEFKMILIIMILFFSLLIINNFKQDKVNGNSIFDVFKNIFNQPVGKEIVNEDIKEEILDSKNNFDFSEVNIEQLKEQTKDLEEQTFTGDLAVIQTDDFENPENSKIYYFLQSNGKNYRLISIDGFDIKSGSKIEVTGNLIENKIYVEDVKKEVRIIEDELDRHAPTLLRYAVILLSFEDDPTEYYTHDEVNNVMATVNDFYKENSHNRFELNWGVYGYYKLNQNSGVGILFFGTFKAFKIISFNLFIAASRFISCERSSSAITSNSSLWLMCLANFPRIPFFSKSVNGKLLILTQS
jgi:hypothetical protein